MHVQIMTFELRGMSETDYRALCEELGPAIAEQPGLLSKLWLADTTRNIYGGVYLWYDRRAMVRFSQSDVFRALAEHPELGGVTLADFAVLDGPTGLTGGVMRPAG